ncbi:hypothetical protein [Baaleninema simplex]|uniref:hypothetical protein n=1 Tax=Baaleninema simplex TaxID=2862350 RepID=UPI0011819A7C|nr:hypothetical protein [Baaleninema simplex]
MVYPVANGDLICPFGVPGFTAFFGVGWDVSVGGGKVGVGVCRWGRCVTRKRHLTVGCENWVVRVTAPYGVCVGVKRWMLE